MSKTVLLVELPVFAGVVPLASGYIETYARKDPLLAQSFRFQKISLPVNTPVPQVLDALERADADVYGFSCYVWNSRMVRRLLAALRQAKPRATYVLGGPQVMHQGEQYLSPHDEQVFVCNGEGERTFAGLLRAMLSPAPDYRQVRGLSFYAGGELVTTPDEPRISDLSEIPSPFLEGVFETGIYTWMLIETNRGCPFKCNYCYWGAATGAKVYKYDETRLQRELQWVSQSGCLYLFIADANWGMLKRDVDLSRWIVECKERYGSPYSVYFCGSKNTPERVAEITRVLHEAGLVSSASVALQTMNQPTLKLVNRENIRTSAYTHIQQSLNQQSISSFVEIIWPLPGETLASFQAGLAQLCEIGADSFVIYPLLLMNNVELVQKREEYGLVTKQDPDPCSEAEIVVRTNEVDGEAYQEGLRYAYTVTALYTLRSLWYLARHLNTTGAQPYADLFRGFVAFSRRYPNHPWTRFCEQSIAAYDNVSYSHTGAILHLVLHAAREAFDDLLERFVQTNGLTREPFARLLFEIDLLNRPYVYRNSRILPKRQEFTQVTVREVLPGGYVIDLPSQWLEDLRRVGLLPRADVPPRWVINHRRAQLPFMSGKSLHEHFMYCQDMSQKMGSVVPLWQTEGAASSVLPASILS